MEAMQQQSPGAFSYNHKRQAWCFNAILGLSIVFIFVVGIDYRAVRGFLVAWAANRLLHRINRAYYENFMGYVGRYLGPAHGAAYDYLRQYGFVRRYKWGQVMGYSMTDEGRAWLEGQTDPVFTVLAKEVTPALEQLNKQSKIASFAPFAVMLLIIALWVVFIPIY